MPKAPIFIKHAGVDHGSPPSGAAHVPHRRPGMKRKNGGQDAEADVEQQKGQAAVEMA
jgi:hypothetical protein